MPIASGALRRMADAPDGSHYQRLYRETALKNQGARDTEKISCRTFVYKCGSGKMPQKIWRLFKKGEYLEFLKNRLRDMGIEAADAVFWFYPENSHISNIVKRFRPAVSVVDLVDDHRTWPGISAARKLWLNRHYKGVLALADIVMTNCRTIQQDMGHLHPQIQLVPNACDPEPPPALSGNRAFDAFRRIPHPRIGYAGNLEQAKIDMDLIDSIARSRPEWQLVLIGSTHANPGVMELDRHENVHFPGVVPYPEIKAWIREFDVAILPHLDSLQTRSMNPLKLYVYCSLGIPVVSTDVANIDAFRNVIAVAGSRQEFVGAVDKALERPVRDVSGEMKACLEEHSWQRRVDWIVGEIAAKAKPRRGSVG